MKSKKQHQITSSTDISESIQKYNPTLKNILRVEQVLSENKEFESKAQLAKKLDITMRPPVLNVILRYLEESGKILLDNDGSIVWIYASPKARKSWGRAIRL
jgi:hypothetical protein